MSEVSELLVEVTILAVLFCCYFARTNLDFEYLGGPIFEREGSQKYAHPPL